MCTQRTFHLPKRVAVGDITVRDGLQALEHYFPADAKVRLAEELVACGFGHVELTNFGSPKYLPQFADAEEVLTRVLDSERIGAKLAQNGGTVTLCVVTINERAVERVLAYKAKHGRGPDFVLQMVSTDEDHHRTNSGTSLDQYWAMTERCTRGAAEVGVKMCGTVSTIWGSPIAGSRQTSLDVAVGFAQRYLELGADYIEHADHDGSADPARVYEYFSKVLDRTVTGKWADPRYHLAHFHTSRGMGLANYLAALQAGVERFECTLSGIGGQPAHTVDGKFTGGTGTYYHFEHLYSGLVSTEDFVVMCASMGIETGVDVRRLLGLGRTFRDEYLRISPQALARLVEAVSASTGLSVAKLGELRESDEPVARLVDEACATNSGGPSGEHLRANLTTLLGSLAGYLRTRAWGPSRAETLISDVPPSPHLVHLLSSH